MLKAFTDFLCRGEVISFIATFGSCFKLLKVFHRAVALGALVCKEGPCLYS